MKKIYFLMLMLLVSVSSVWAQDWGNIGSLKVSPAMQDGEFVSGTTFYQIQNKKSGYLSTSSMSGDNLSFATSGMAADGFRWAILGDAENGFQFVNKVTKQAIAMNKFEVTNLENQSDKTVSYLTDDLTDQNTLFALAPHKYVAPYFIITANDDHYYYWNQLGTLGYWYSGEGYEYGYRGWKQNAEGTANSNKGDDGASFCFNEVETLTLTNADYTVVIVGAPEGYTVSYDGADYANGDVIANVVWDVTKLTVTPLEGYNSEVSVEGTTVTITFTRKPITSLDEVEVGRLYTLTSVDRGSFVYASDYNAENLSGSNRAGVEFDATNANFQFAFVQSGDNTYLWSRGAGQFAAYADPNVTLSSTVPAAGLTLLASTGAEKVNFPTVLTIDGEHQINMSKDQEQGLLTNWNDTADKGNMLAIVATDATLSQEELMAIDAILNPVTQVTFQVTDNEDGTFTFTPSSDEVNYFVHLTSDAINQEQSFTDNQDAFEKSVAFIMNASEEVRQGQCTINAAEWLNHWYLGGTPYVAGDYSFVVGVVESTPMGWEKVGDLTTYTYTYAPETTYTYTLTITGAPEGEEVYVTVTGDETHYVSGDQITTSKELTLEDIDAPQFLEQGYARDIEIDNVAYTIKVTYTKAGGPTQFPAEGVAYKVKEINGGCYVSIIEDDTQAVALSTTAQEIYFEATTGGFYIKNAAGLYMTEQAKGWNIASTGTPIVWEVEAHDGYYALKNSAGYLGFNATTEGVKGFRDKGIGNNGIFEIIEFAAHELTLAEKLQALVEETNTLLATSPSAPQELLNYAEVWSDNSAEYLKGEKTTDERLEYYGIILQRNLDRINGFDATKTAAQWMEELKPVYEQAKKYIDANETDYEYNYETQEIDVYTTLAGKVGYKPYGALYDMLFNYDDIDYYLTYCDSPEDAEAELEAYGYGLWYYAYVLQDDILNYERVECVLPEAGKHYVIRTAPDRYSFYLTTNEEFSSLTAQQWSSSFAPGYYSAWTCTGMKAYNKVNDELETEYVEDRLQFVSMADNTKYLGWKKITNGNNAQSFWHISGKEAPQYGALSMQAYDGANHFKFLTIQVANDGKGSLNHGDGWSWVENSQYSSWYIFEETTEEAVGVGTVLAPTVLNSGSAIYNLQGQRMNKIQRGLNIINNKKVLK